jgi:hypothetical protein
LNDEPQGDADGDGNRAVIVNQSSVCLTSLAALLSSQTGNGGNNSGEDKHWHQGPQQQNKGGTNSRKRLRQPVPIAGSVWTSLASDVAEDKADDHGGEHLEAKASIKWLEPTSAGQVWKQ